MGTLLLRLSWTLPWLLPAVAAAMDKPRPSAIGAGPAGPHLLALQAAAVLAVIALLIVVYAVISFRRERASATAAGTWSWLLVPLMVLLIIVSFFGDTLQVRKLLGAVAAERPLEVKVTAYQDRWEYEYLGRGVRLESRPGDACGCDAEPPLLLPAGREVRFLGTSADVPHPFALPALGIQHEMIPGYVSEAWAVPAKEGTYRGGCVECSLQRAAPVVVRVVSAGEFDAWLAARQRKEVVRSGVR